MIKRLITLVIAALAMMTVLTGCDIVKNPQNETQNSPVGASPDMSPENTDEIKDFMSGTVVDLEEVPELVRTVTRRYSGATVRSITHAMHLDRQMYEVVFMDRNGDVRTVFVSSDGKDFIEGDDFGS